MNLYLIQHAQAFAREQYADRPLTEEGYWQAQQTAEFIKRLRISVGAVWHSGKTRALQTAKIFHPALQGKPAFIKQDGLAPDDDPEPIAKKIEQLGADLMIVGHLPFLSRLTGLLLCGRPDSQPVVFDKAGVVCLRQNQEGLWQINWIVKPDIL